MGHTIANLRVQAQSEATNGLTLSVLVPYTAGKGCLLQIGTYYFLVGDDAGTMKAIGLRWGAAFAGTITFETSNFESSMTPTNLDQVNDWESGSLGNWCQENPSTAYVAMDFVNTALAGSSKIVWTGLTGVVTAGVVGGSMLQIGNTGARRQRVKVVCTASDYFRVAANGKD